MQERPIREKHVKKRRRSALPKKYSRTFSQSRRFIREGDARFIFNEKDGQEMAVFFDVVDLDGTYAFDNLPEDHLCWSSGRKYNEEEEEYSNRREKEAIRRTNHFKLLGQITKIIKRKGVGTDKQWEICKSYARNFLYNIGKTDTQIARELSIPQSTLYQQLYGRKRKSKFINGLIPRLVKYIEINEPHLLKLI